jgi:hypothetical protein
MRARPAPAWLHTESLVFGDIRGDVCGVSCGVASFLQLFSSRSFGRVRAAPALESRRSFHLRAGTQVAVARHARWPAVILGGDVHGGASVEVEFGNGALRGCLGLELHHCGGLLA